MTPASATLETPPHAVVSQLDPYDEAVLRDPYPHYAALRDAGPVVWMQRYGVWAVARHDEVQATLADPATFCSSAGVGFAHFGKETPWRKPSIILEADPPDHSRTRRVLTRVMSPGALAKLRPVFEAAATRFVDDLLERGSFDGVTHLAEAYPTQVFGDAVGLPSEGRENLMPYGDMVFNGFGPINDRFKARMATSGAAVAWINGVCARDQLSADGFGAALYAAADAGDITSEEAGLLVRTLLSAGLDTTVFTLGNALWCLARHPDQWALLRQNPKLARQALEEVLRYEPTFHSFYRTTTRPVDIGGTLLAADDKLIVFIGSANRDPRRWDQPEHFDITRKASGNMAFGTGIHGCVGQMMARLEGEIILNAMAQRIESLELVGEPVLHLNNTVRGLASLPLRVLPRTQAAAVAMTVAE